MVKFSHGRPGRAQLIFHLSAFGSKTSRLKHACCAITHECFTNQCPRTRLNECWRKHLANPRLEAILAAIFEAEFCAPEQKKGREQTRDFLLQEEAAKTKHFVGTPEIRYSVKPLYRISQTSISTRTSQHSA